MKINQRGQSALEYLMTYGWALVVIVIVVAALVLLVGNPSANDSCGNPGTGFSISNQNLVAAASTLEAWDIRVSNITGKTITLKQNDNTTLLVALTWTPKPGDRVPAAGDILLNAVALGSTDIVVNPGAAVTLTIKAPAGGTTGDVAANSKYNTAFKLNYHDGDFVRTVALNCNGTA